MILSVIDFESIVTSRYFILVIIAMIFVIDTICRSFSSSWVRVPMKTIKFFIMLIIAFLIFNWVVFLDDYTNIILWSFTPLIKTGLTDYMLCSVIYIALCTYIINKLFYTILENCTLGANSTWSFIAIILNVYILRIGGSAIFNYDGFSFLIGEILNFFIVLFIFVSVTASINHWRCPNCGHSDSTTQKGSHYGGIKTNVSYKETFEGSSNSVNCDRTVFTTTDNYNQYRVTEVKEATVNDMYCSHCRQPYHFTTYRVIGRYSDLIGRRQESEETTIS